MLFAGKKTKSVVTALNNDDTAQERVETDARAVPSGDGDAQNAKVAADDASVEAQLILKKRRARPVEKRGGRR